MQKSLTAKLQKFMRVCAVQLIAAITLCGMSLAYPGYAQLLDQEVTVTMRDVPFERALKVLEKAASVKFAYSIDQLENEPNVSLSIQKQTLREALDVLFTPRKIRYKVHEKDAMITLQKIDKTKEDERSMRMNGASGDMIQVSGRVTEASTGTPMAGVNVVVKGTVTGTTTDYDGRYALATEEDDILVFSFIGFTSMEIPVNTRTVIDIAMTQDVQNLGEVVVNAGYWEVKEKEKTGSISRITADVIENQPVNNPLQALQGRMTGVYIQQTTGMAGGGFKIQIRGQNSLRTGSGGTVNGNLPLYLVDGIPFTNTSLTSSYTSSSNIQGGDPLSVINPDDIESIEVLKDADATAIYGSRGANGVVLITTKKAKEGKTSLDVSINQGIGQVGRRMDLLNTQQYLDMRKEGLRNDGLAALLEDPAYDPYWPDLKAWDSTRYTDWQKQLLGGTGNITNAQMTISGGNTNTQFLLSSNFYRETTVFPGKNSYRKGTARLNLNHASDDNRFGVSSSIYYASSVSEIPTLDLTSLAVTLAPDAPSLYDANGSLNWENGTWSNPLSFLERDYTNTIENLIANASAQYKITPALVLKASLGYTTMRVNEIAINPLRARDPEDLAGRTGSSVFADGNIKTWITEPQLTYAANLGRGDLRVLFGATFQESLQTGKTIEARGFTSDALLENIQAGTSLSILDATYSQYRYAALFGRVNYNWLGKYVVNVTGRRDGSSRFGPGNRFANFGAIGIAWIFSSEKFVSENISFLSFGKLRASYGTTGSDAIGNYQYLNTFSPTPYPYNNGGGLSLSRLNNPDYSWETNRKLELGIDLNLIRDRIALSAAHYRNRSSNQLVGLPLPTMTGQTSVQFNLPAVVQNTGWEFYLETRNIQRQNFEWATRFNITVPDNKLIAFPQIENFSSYNNKYEIGNSLSVYKALEYTGVDPQTGLYTFNDRDGDGILSTTLDIIALRETDQQYYGGLANSLTYKRFQLDFFVQFVKQMGQNYMTFFGLPGSLSNQPTHVMGRWQKEGDVANIQRFTVLNPGGSVSRASNYYRFSNQIITDASFLRVKNISIAWNLPSRWIRKANLGDSRIFLQGQNLFTFTNYIGYDPESMTSTALPPLRVITAGLQVKF